MTRIHYVILIIAGALLLASSLFPPRTFAPEGVLSVDGNKYPPRVCLFSQDLRLYSSDRTFVVQLDTSRYPLELASILGLLMVTLPTASIYTTKRSKTEK